VASREPPRAVRGVGLAGGAARVSKSGECARVVGEREYRQRVTEGEIGSWEVSA
jgi:hypothetical protein